jgi:NADH-quinone oxidoreductase subunit N
LQVSLLNYFYSTICYKQGFIALVIVAVINSIISVGYYFKVILAMYTKNLMKKTGTPVVIYAVAVIAIVLNIALGLFPSFVLDLLA